MDARSKEVIVIKPTKAQSKEDRLHVAAYCRVSTDSSAQLNSFFAQMKYYTDYIRSHDNMVLVDIYADEGITGMVIQKREEFKRLIRDCKNKRIDSDLLYFPEMKGFACSHCFHYIHSEYFGIPGVDIEGEEVEIDDNIKGL